MAGEVGKVATAIAFIGAMIIYAFMMLVVWVMVVISFIKKIIGKCHGNKAK